MKKCAANPPSNTRQSFEAPQSCTHEYMLTLFVGPPCVGDQFSFPSAPPTRAYVVRFAPGDSQVRQDEIWEQLVFMRFVGKL